MWPSTPGGESFHKLHCRLIYRILSRFWLFKAISCASEGVFSLFEVVLDTLVTQTLNLSQYQTYLSKDFLGLGSRERLKGLFFFEHLRRLGGIQQLELRATSCASLS